MGQNSSVHHGSRSDRRKSFRNSWRSPFPRRSQTHQGTLSAAVNFIDEDSKYIEQLNINTASEEELMTLPGITRSVAKSIVEYRSAIGRFKKVEDLALVSGVGAEKLDRIRPEICVGRRKNLSCASSRAQSIDSLQSTDTSNNRLTIRNSPFTASRSVDVNSATVFDLMAVDGLNQELAANVVHHRDKKGPFRAIEDLLKVKGISYVRLSALRSQLTVGGSNKFVKNGFNLSATSLNGIQISNGKPPGHRKTHSASMKFSGMPNGFLGVNDIFELLSASSQRPIVEEDFQYERNERPAIRLASWNFHNMSLDKIDNPGVREVVCRTILENRFSVIAVQEILDGAALNKLCEELNNPKLRRVSEWKDNSRNWDYCVPDETDDSYTTYGGLCYLYDAGSNLSVEVIRELVVSDVEGLVVPGVGVLQAILKLGDVRLSLLNIYLRNDEDSCVQSIKQIVEDNCKDMDGIVILGDFSGLSQNKKFEEIQQLEYKFILPTTIATNFCDRDEFQYSDNILLNSEAFTKFTGISGIVRQGLVHLAIPRGWMWGGAASEHCPVWCEIFTDSGLLQKPVANGGIASH